MPKFNYRDLTSNENNLSKKPFEGDRSMGGASEYIGPGSNDKAGAGRGGQGGPTAKELQKYEDKLNEGIYTKEKGKPPSPREMAKGGKVSSASKRADGIATKGKTKGTMITMCGGGMAKRK